jgi:hypothetical protein
MKDPALEAAVKTLDIRVTRIDQILPTLATKDDLLALETRLDARWEARLGAGRSSLEATLTDRIDAVSRQMLVFTKT